MELRELREIGFEPLPHFTVGANLNYDLGRRRFLSISCLGTPNEMLCVGEIDKSDEMKVTDMVVLHNFDYDGYLTIEKVKSLITGIVGRKFE